MTDSPPDVHPPLRRNRNFWLFVLCRSSNVIGVHALTVAVGWHVYNATRDPLDLGFIGLAQFAPAFAVFLLAGLAADRFDRRRILVVCNAIHVVAVAALTALLAAHPDAVGGVLAILVAHGAARSFFHTASQTILPNVVPPAQFPKAVAYAQSANKAAQLTGPALGGLLIAWTGDGVYLAIIAFFVAAGTAAALIRGSLKVQGREPFSVETVLGGFMYVWNNKMVLGAISMDLLAVMLGGVMGLLPVYASDILHVGPDGLGLMRAMPGFGSLLMGAVLTQVASPSRMGTALFLSLGGFGASICVFGLSESLWLSLCALAVYGAADMISVYVRQTVVQIATPDRMRGRVSAVNSISINASNELGDFRAGVMAGGFGTVTAVVFGGAATLALAVLWARLFPTLRGIDRLEDLIEAAKPEADAAKT